MRRESVEGRCYPVACIARRYKAYEMAEYGLDEADQRTTAVDETVRDDRTVLRPDARLPAHYDMVLGA